MTDLTATQPAGLWKLKRKTVNTLDQRFRLLIWLQFINERRAFRGGVEVDECYFGPSRVRGRGAAGARSSSPVSGVLSIIRGRIDPRPLLRWLARLR
ncbi:MAG: hypothetical protein WCE51_00615 [Chthoniobacterales bacterium]